MVRSHRSPRFAFRGQSVHVERVDGGRFETTPCTGGAAAGTGPLLCGHHLAGDEGEFVVVAPAAHGDVETEEILVVGAIDRPGHLGGSMQGRW